MTDFAGLLAPDLGQPARDIVPVSPATLEAFRARLPDAAQAAMDGAGFAGKADQALALPLADGWCIAVGLGEEGAPGRWALAAAADVAPAGTYRFAGPLPDIAMHGWLMAQHRFARYRKADDRKGPRFLLSSDPAAVSRAIAEAEAAALLRDMVDTPAEDMGPGELEAVARDLSARHGARIEVVTGDGLLEQGFPAVHAVGRASPRRPRIITLDWGAEGRPLIALVGKGITFDTGGLNLKPGASMALMKKDMGGAAHAIALARLVMAAKWPVRLKLVVAAADNAVSGQAIRPGDVIATRKGLWVEIGNTDAEGRLVLADALALAAEAKPALILDFATLTGAARVALGPDLPALFASDDRLAADLLEAGAEVQDPLWRLPLWRPYRRMFSSIIADLNNNAEGGLAGAIVGALFLEHFVPDGVPWAHLDLYAWNGTAKPGRPKGGAAMGLFAAFAALGKRFLA
ncbi:leucyl aminopeptidase family protein [Thermaurantiacus sp.]